MLVSVFALSSLFSSSFWGSSRHILRYLAGDCPHLLFLHSLHSSGIHHRRQRNDSHCKNQILLELYCLAVSQQPQLSGPPLLNTVHLNNCLVEDIFILYELFLFSSLFGRGTVWGGALNDALVDSLLLLEYEPLLCGRSSSSMISSTWLDESPNRSSFSLSILFLVSGDSERIPAPAPLLGLDGISNTSDFSFPRALPPAFRGDGKVDSGMGPRRKVDPAGPPESHSESISTGLCRC